MTEIADEQQRHRNTPWRRRARKLARPFTARGRRVMRLRRELRRLESR